MIIVCCCTAYIRNSLWSSPLTLWQDVVQKKPWSARAHNNLGNSYGLLNRWPEAITEYRQALALNRYNVEAYYNLGMCLEKVNLGNEAVYYYGIYCKDAPPTALKPIACERYDALSKNKK